MRVRIQLAIGFCVYLAAFFLPAIQSTEAGSGSGPIVGWICAAFALAPFAGLFHGSLEGITPDALLMMLAGLTNPLLLVYLVLRIWPRLAIARWVIAAGALAGIVTSWFIFAQTHLKPLIGHFLWVAGLAILLGSELWSLGQRGAQPSSSTSE